MLRRLRDLALAAPVIVTVNDCVATVAVVDAADLPGATGRSPSIPDPEVPSRARPAGPSRTPAGPSADRARAWVVLDRSAARTFAFKRGDVVRLRHPSDPRAWVTRRLVALEGDWISDEDGPRDVHIIPKGHVRLERVNEASATASASGSAPSPNPTDAAPNDRGEGNARARANRAARETHRAEGSVPGPRAPAPSFANATDAPPPPPFDRGTVPYALLDARVPFALWPPERFGRVERKSPGARLVPREAE